MFSRNRLAAAWSAFVMSWKEKNIAAEKTWNGPQFMCPGTASAVFERKSGRVCPTSAMSCDAALTAISRLSGTFAYGRCSVNRMWWYAVRMMTLWTPIRRTEVIGLPSARAIRNSSRSSSGGRASYHSVRSLSFSCTDAYGTARKETASSIMSPRTYASLKSAMFGRYSRWDLSTAGSQYVGSWVLKWWDAIASGRPNMNACHRSRRMMCHHAHRRRSATLLSNRVDPGSRWRPMAVPIVTSSPRTAQVSSGSSLANVR